MKLLKRQLKHGIVKVLVQSPDDLWYLYTIIEPGDTCTGQSEYKYRMEGTNKTVRKHVWVALEVEKTEFRQETGQLRISGSVKDGSEEVPRGSHHSLDIQEGRDLQISKERWMDYHIEKLEDAQNSGERTLVLLFDRERAIFFLLRPNGHEVLAELKGDVQKKGLDEEKSAGFYKDLAKHMEEYLKRHEAHRVVAASPGFWKDYLQKELSGDLKSKVVFASVSEVDESALSELLKRPELKQALAGERAAREEELVSSAMEALGKDALVYGLEDLKANISEGNIKMLLVTEKTIMKMKEKDNFDELESIMRSASDVDAEVHLLASDAGEKIDGLGGVAGVKRW